MVWPWSCTTQRGDIHDEILRRWPRCSGRRAAVGLADFGKPGNYFARQIARWSEQYRASRTPGDPGDGRADRSPAGALSRRRRRSRPGPRRLPHRQPDVRARVARGCRGGRLGAVDPGPSARRPGLFVHGAATAAQSGAARPGRPGSRRAGHPVRSRDARALLANSAAGRFRPTGRSCSPSASSASPPSPRAWPSARSKAMPPANRPRRPAR